MAFKSLPKWCKIGQWVTYRYCKTVTDMDPNKLPIPHMICEIADDGTIVVINDHLESCHHMKYTELIPVKFRAYNFKEAKKLLGKIIEMHDIEDETSLYADLITHVEYTPDNESLINKWTRKNSVKLNYSTFEDLQRYGATIDGMPIGIPEYDFETYGTLITELTEDECAWK